MKLSVILTSIALAALPALSVTISYDPVYDRSSQSLATVACSDGPNGLLTKGFTTFGSLPTFPRIGGVSDITGWNSANCGSCWKITYVNSSGIPNFINVLGIDQTTNGANIGLTAMNQLTNGHAVQFGVVDATIQRVNPSVCGL